MTGEQIKFIKETYLPGVRVRLISMEKEPQMPAGLTGVVTIVDDIGQIHTLWENGSSLALNCDVDEFIAFSGPTAREYLYEIYPQDAMIWFREEIPGCVRAIAIDLERLVKETEEYMNKIVGITSKLAAIMRKPYETSHIFDVFLSCHILSDEDVLRIREKRNFSSEESEQWRCPKCGSGGLAYGQAKLEDCHVVYPWTCGTCSAKGKEYGSIEFDGHYIDQLPDYEK